MGTSEPVKVTRYDGTVAYVRPDRAAYTAKNVRRAHKQAQRDAKRRPTNWVVLLLALIFLFLFFFMPIVW